MPRAQLLKLTAIAAMLATSALLLWAHGAKHSCCHVSLGTVHAQDPPTPQDEPEGNPDHVEPKHHCSDNPIGQQIACKCKAHKKCAEDGTVTESSKCKSWCFKFWCICPDPICP